LHELVLAEFFSLYLRLGFKSYELSMRELRQAM